MATSLVSRISSCPRIWCPSRPCINTMPAARRLNWRSGSSAIFRSGVDDPGDARADTRLEKECDLEDANDDPCRKPNTGFPVDRVDERHRHRDVVPITELQKEIVVCEAIAKRHSDDKIRAIERRDAANEALLFPLW